MIVLRMTWNNKNLFSDKFYIKTNLKGKKIDRQCRLKRYFRYEEYIIQQCKVNSYIIFNNFEYVTSNIANILIFVMHLNVLFYLRANYLQKSDSLHHAYLSSVNLDSTQIILAYFKMCKLAFLSVSSWRMLLAQQYYASRWCLL